MTELYKTHDGGSGGNTGQRLPLTVAVNSDPVNEAGQKCITLKLLRNGVERRWVLPWALCQTWQALSDTLRKLFCNDDDVSSYLKEDRFDIQRPDGSILAPIFWDCIAGGESVLRLKLHDGVEDAPEIDTTPLLATSLLVQDKERLHSRTKARRRRSRSRSSSSTGSTSKKSSSTESNTTSEASEDEEDSKFKDVFIANVQHSVQDKRSGWKEDSFDSPVTLGPFEDDDDESDSASEKDDSEIIERRLPVLQELIRFTSSEPSHRHTKDPWTKPTKKDMSRSRKTLIIHSQKLMFALEAVVNYGPLKLKKAFRFPFALLYYFKDDLLEYKNSTELNDRHTREFSDETARHIDILVAYLYSQKEIPLEQFESKMREKRPSIGWKELWLLLKPGMTVYVRSGHSQRTLNAYILDSFNRAHSIVGSLGITVNVWRLGLDPKKGYIDRIFDKISISHFGGEMYVDQLPVFPCRFYQDKSGETDLREKLVLRGRKYVDLLKGPAFREYSGRGSDGEWYERIRVVVDRKPEKIATSQTQGQYAFQNIGKPDQNPGPQPPSEESLDLLLKGLGAPKKKGSAGVIPLPPAGFNPFGPFGLPVVTVNDYSPSGRIGVCGCSNCVLHAILKKATFAAYDRLEPKTGEFSDHHYLLCDSKVDGFVLKSRVWALLDVDNIFDPDVEVDIIDQLVMRTESNKTLLKAITRAYMMRDSHITPYAADLIRGKSEGHIILLHGPPGTGKTLTAECVAECTKRPLLSISSADLGDEPVALEQNLLTFLRDAHRWNALVLLDEADVYLEARSKQDLKRNSVVSIFLRAFDYFKGIIFLTTNRVGSFDEAFMSRIHIQIGYGPLDDTVRKRIWEINFHRLKEAHTYGGRKTRYEWEAKEYVQKSSDVADLKWNGREIRNAFQTAVALARDEAEGDNIPILKEYHIRQVVDMSKAFKIYMKSTHENMDESEWAYRHGIRDDQAPQS